MPDLLNSATAPIDLMLRDATLSDDGLYRYDLFRCWDDSWVEATDPAAYFVMLNPSTADHEIDDRTIGRCVGFARSWGFKALFVVNIYALKATKPERLWVAADPIGSLNESYLRAALTRSVGIGGLVVVAWGTNAREPEVEAFRVLRDELGASTWALTINSDGSPKHPLYVKADRALDRWT